MKTTCLNLIVIATLACAGNAFAQSNFQETVTTSWRDSIPTLNRDFWFAPAQNNVDTDDNKYIRLYITSPINTSAYVECGSTRDTVPVAAFGIGAFKVPLAWELNSSGIVENKAIHVWSPDSDIAVYVMSHFPYSSDGMYCIPTQDLGTDYVVAGYESYFVSASDTNDFPSEFTIAAFRDSTIVDITPTTDLRRSTVYPANNTAIIYPRGVMFQIRLNRGQAVQYQAVKAVDAINYDVTGTLIHSNNSVGVVGASMYPNIPANFNFAPAFYSGNANYICDMMMPIGGWGKTYYVTNPVQPTGMIGHDYSMYCFISSVQNQTIYSYNSISKQNVLAVLGPAYDHWFEEVESANKFFSDAPFMLVQYINSAAYPDTINGDGNPAEVVIYPKENYTKSVLFTASNSAGSQAPYDNYASLIVNVNDAKNVTIDGKKITNYSRLPIDDTFEIYVAPHLSGSSHVVKSDSGCNVTVYGYGYDETYAWSGSMGVLANGSSDTISPVLSFMPGSSCIHATITDSGSGLGEIILDTTLNLSFDVDSKFNAGSGDIQSFANFCVNDSSLKGYLQFTVNDLAGNNSVGTIEFTPSAPGFTTKSTPGFDTVLVGTSKTLGVFTVTDTSQTFPITIDSLWTDNSAFSLSSNSLPVTLNPGGLHTFSVTFSPLADTSYSANAYAHSAGLAARSASLTGTGYSINAGVTGSQTKVYATLTPNPAAKSVSLDFSLSQTANVSFELSSMDGKNVFNWKSDEQNAGQHIETLDISSIAQGDYIYRFSANGEVTSGKLAIVR